MRRPIAPPQSTFDGSCETKSSSADSSSGPTTACPPTVHESLVLSYRARFGRKTMDGPTSTPDPWCSLFSAADAAKRDGKRAVVASIGASPWITRIRVRIGAFPRIARAGVRVGIGALPQIARG